jgi:LysM repeat protein
LYYEQLKRRATLLAVATALVALTLVALLPGAVEAQEEGVHEGGSTITPLPATDPTPTQAPTPQVLVTPGDSLWAIAQGYLGPEATPQQVANEVERIFELNRERIGDNPNLILVGQQLSLVSMSEPSGIWRIRVMSFADEMSRPSSSPPAPPVARTTPSRPTSAMTPPGPSLIES